MGVQNPNTRGGRAVSTMTSSQSVNREQGGGNSKAGLGRHIGMNPFIFAAIVNGAAGHAAPAFAGPNYPAAHRAWLRTRNTNPGKGPIVGVDTLYPIGTANQLSTIGMNRAGVGGMHGPSADGVNKIFRARMEGSARAFNAMWPAQPTRGMFPPPLPPNPPNTAPGMGYPFGTWRGV
jgi:hypothetical protein